MERTDRSFSPGPLRHVGPAHLAVREEVEASGPPFWASTGNKPGVVLKVNTFPSQYGVNMAYLFLCGKNDIQ